MEILGIKIDNFSKAEILKKINDFLEDEKFHQIITLNPEFILEAQKNSNFKNILNTCDLRVTDGFGVVVAASLCNEKIRCRITGIDLMEEILKIAQQKNRKIFIIANDNGLSSWQETCENLLKKYPQLQISGMNLNKENSVVANDEIMQSDVIFCNFGAPRQEIFLDSLKNIKGSKIRVVMGVGGSFDYVSRKIKRAPIWMRKIGIEWMFRLIQQPKRIKRIWNATVIFLLKIILNKKLCQPKQN